MQTAIRIFDRNVNDDLLSLASVNSRNIFPNCHRSLFR